MKNLLAFFAAIVLATVSAQAQPGGMPWKKQLSLDAGVQFPSGALGDAMNTGYGISGTFYYQLLSRNTFVSASAGYNSFAGGSNAQVGTSIIPLLVGIRYNFSITGVQPYIGLETGAYITSQSVNGVAVESAGSTDFGLMPKFGVRVPLSPGFDLDASLKYHTVFAEENYSFAGLNLGVAYTID